MHEVKCEAERKGGTGGKKEDRSKRAADFIIWQ